MVKTSKDVKIKIDKNSLHVTSKNACGVWVDLIRDSLSWKVKPDECTWSLLPSDHIHVYVLNTCFKFDIYSLFENSLFKLNPRYI